MQQLETLILDDTNIDAFTLLDLASLKKLQTLSLVGIQLSETDVDQIKRVLPNGKVITVNSNPKRNL